MEGKELECKICYNRYDTRSRKPKLLGCLHRVCAKCLKKMVDMGEFTWQVDTQHSQLLDHADASMTITWSHHLLYHPSHSDITLTLPFVNTSKSPSHIPLVEIRPISVELRDDIITYRKWRQSSPVRRHLLTNQRHVTVLGMIIKLFYLLITEHTCTCITCLSHSHMT
uniref:E3 ubiquitin-protein ligase RNF182 n=1 Tax=Pundamilia nyererei TaxID=303518 RepID=A0A3B4FZL0_9CICH